MKEATSYLAEKGSLPEKGTLPVWFSYPDAIRALVETGAVNFTPWYIVNSQFALPTYEHLRARYTRELFPIAHLCGTDDTACLEEGCGCRVKIINGYTTPGHETVAEYETVADWLRVALDDMLELHGM